MKLLVFVWLGAVVLANLSAAHFGPDASIINAFLLVGLTVTTRDRLHDELGEGRLWKMALLIAVGGALSYALNADAGRIALGSCAAFVVAMAAGTGVYHTLLGQRWLRRSNASNVVEAVLDSLVFVLIAFGPLWGIVAAQVLAKVLGGFLWSLAYNRRVEPATA